MRRIFVSESAKKLVEDLRDILKNEEAWYIAMQYLDEAYREGYEQGYEVGREY